jgi:hypothetical protein
VCIVTQSPNHWWASSWAVQVHAERAEPRGLVVERDGRVLHAAAELRQEHDRVAGPRVLAEPDLKGGHQLLEEIEVRLAIDRQPAPVPHRQRHPASRALDALEGAGRERHQVGRDRLVEGVAHHPLGAGRAIHGALAVGDRVVLGRHRQLDREGRAIGGIVLGDQPAPTAIGLGVGEGDPRRHRIVVARTADPQRVRHRRGVGDLDRHRPGGAAGVDR